MSLFQPFCSSSRLKFSSPSPTPSPAHELGLSPKPKKIENTEKTKKKQDHRLADAITNQWQESKKLMDDGYQHFKLTSFVFNKDSWKIFCRLIKHMPKENKLKLHFENCTFTQEQLNKLNEPTYCSKITECINDAPQIVGKEIANAWEKKKYLAQNEIKLTFVGIHFDAFHWEYFLSCFDKFLINWDRNTQLQLVFEKCTFDPHCLEQLAQEKYRSCINGLHILGSQPYPASLGAGLEVFIEGNQTLKNLEINQIEAHVETISCLLKAIRDNNTPLKSLILHDHELLPADIDVLTSWLGRSKTITMLALTGSKRTLDKECTLLLLKNLKLPTLKILWLCLNEQSEDAEVTEAIIKANLPFLRELRLTGKGFAAIKIFEDAMLSKKMMRILEIKDSTATASELLQSVRKFEENAKKHYREEQFNLYVQLQDENEAEDEITDIWYSTMDLGIMWWSAKDIAEIGYVGYVKI